MVRHRETAKLSPFPVPRHSPKYLGHTINRYRPLKPGNLVNGVVDDEIPIHVTHWNTGVNRASAILANTLLTLDPPLALPDQVYTYYVLLGYSRPFPRLSTIHARTHRYFVLLSTDIQTDE